MSVEFGSDSKPQATAIGSAGPAQVQISQQTVGFDGKSRTATVSLREREAIYRNWKETCGMDSTVR
jgi:hypothetical protein